MPVSQRDIWVDDPWGQVGRGLAIILAITMPFVGRMDALPLSVGRTLPVASLLGLMIPLFAIASVARGCASAVRGRWVLPLALGLGLVSGLGALTYGNDPVLAVADLWEPILLVAGIAVLYAGRPLERLALLTSLALSTLFAIVLGFGELFQFPGIADLLRMFHDSAQSWQLLLRLTGPLTHADALAWVTVVIMPLLAGIILDLEGKLRQLLLLVLGIFWLATLLTLSYGAPIAGLAGVLVVMAARSGVRRSMAALSVPLLAGLLVAMLYPGFRARWGPYQDPVGFTVRALTTLESVHEDSLAVTLVNPGPVTWQEGFETGYHLLYPEPPGPHDSIRMLRGGWISTPITQVVHPGEQVSVTLPFRSTEDSGFLMLDLKGPGGKLTEYSGSPYLLLFQSDLPGEPNRVGHLIHVRSSEYVKAANDALRRGSDIVPPSLTDIWRDVYALLGARPLFGLGPGASVALLGYNAGNLFLEVTVAGGWIGLAATIVLILGVNIGLLTRGTLEGCVLSGALFTAVLHGMTAYVLDDPSVRTAMMILMGVAWAVAFEPPDPENEPSEELLERLLRRPFWKKSSPPGR